MLDLNQQLETPGEKTKRLAKDTLDGTFAGTFEGYVQTIWDGVTGTFSAAATGLEALLGDPDAQAKVRAGAGAAYDYVTNLNNLPYLLGALTPDQREQLAQAYERGDGEAVGKILGAQVANLPIGGGLGTIKKVEKVADVATDAAKAARTTSGTIYKTTKEATQAAEALGYRRINETINGQAVYTNGERYITRDVDGHNGGAWKMADSVKNLASKSTRQGTSLLSHKN